MCEGEYKKDLEQTAYCCTPTIWVHKEQRCNLERGQIDLELQSAHQPGQNYRKLYLYKLCQFKELPTMAFVLNVFTEPYIKDLNYPFRLIKYNNDCYTNRQND